MRYHLISTDKLGVIFLQNLTVHRPTSITEFRGLLEKERAELKKQYPQPLESKQDGVDIILFAGQSNMAGRGKAHLAPYVKEGYEFRPVSAPKKLFHLQEPFGKTEDNPTGINDENKKSGSLVSSLVNAYYDCTRRIVVGISASKGGSSILEWQPKSPYCTDILERLQRCENFLHQQNIPIKSRFLVWCQGETDGDHAMSSDEYKMRFTALQNALSEAGIEETFLIQIGNKKDEPKKYQQIIYAQRELAQEKQVVLIANAFEWMDRLDLMKDNYHYTQTGYNLCGDQAGLNLAAYILNKPTL